ncbi:MAG: hypothetical protein FJY81_02350, partial [Candidatus Aminicenantes bacterium]|nr:hypothetical protein [Candidatus Aminicenantes bacterium]
MNRRGGWEENPETLRDRISHALLFDLWQKGESAFPPGFETALGFLVSEQVWPLIQKIGESLRGESRPDAEAEAGSDGPGGRPDRQAAAGRASFLLLFETLLWILERMSLRLNTGVHVPEWNVKGLALREEFRQKLCRLDSSLEAVFSGEQKRRFLQAVSRFEEESAHFTEPLARLVAEEEKITAPIEKLLEEASLAEDKEEAYAAIIESLQPPMGIVTQLPPALFFPSLRLLADPRVDASSGIPHAASVVLSIFADPRSAGTLLRALDRYPLSCAKIRENLIYTLGNLGEERAVAAIARVLDEQGEILPGDGPGEKKPCVLLEQKEEAIWALGKIGFPSARALSSLVRYADHPSARLKTYLAWTLGEIGRAQKEKTGGVSADLVIALLRLLKEKNKQVFEEAASGLKKIQMPEFLHSLYLYNAGAVSILGLKPAQRGLNELSETVHHLLKTKKRAILAINGDSGTGKTYFCQAISAGFAGLQPSDILHVMRDSRRGQRIFNRLLGLAWLKQHIDPAYYQDYPLSEAEEDPQAFLREFLKENSGKRLILLDGCRDRHYFQRVIDIFYQNGELDVEVNFRANFSTRRLNLEERESALESVKLHLDFLEEPALEDTSFYQEGLIVLYDLDNSLGSRLNQEETRELFETSRIDSWGEFIRLGAFPGEKEPGACRQDNLHLEEGSFVCYEERWPKTRTFPFSPEEEICTPRLNENSGAEPNLLMAIPLERLEPDCLRFYAQDQVAGRGRNGRVFVLTLLDNRLFKTSLEDTVIDLSLLGRTFFLTTGRRLLSLSFEKNEIHEFLEPGILPTAMASCPPDHLITAHADGTVRLWDFLEKKVFLLSAGLPPARALAVDFAGRIYTSSGGNLWRWDFWEKKITRISGIEATVRMMRPYLKGRILAVGDSASDATPSTLFILDFEGQRFHTVSAPLSGQIAAVNFSSDGRILAGLSAPERPEDSPAKTLAILTPGEDACIVSRLSGHAKETRDCLPLGPRIISCGEETDGSSSVRLWGGEFYVRTELGKLRIKP